MFFLASVANTVSALNIAYKANQRMIRLPLCKKNEAVLKKLLTLGLIQSLSIKKVNNKRTVSIILAYQYGRPVLKKIILISTSSKKYTASIKSLQRFASLDVSTKYIISTSFGLLTEQEAFFKHVGGMLLLKYFLN
jgi:ribosomal protein S8